MASMALTEGTCIAWPDQCDRYSKVGWASKTLAELMSCYSVGMIIELSLTVQQAEPGRLSYLLGPSSSTGLLAEVRTTTLKVQS